MRMDKDFNYAVILSLVTERLFCDFSDLHKAIEWICDRPVFTHEIPAVWPMVLESIFEKYPHLKEVAEMVNLHAHDYQLYSMREE